MFFDNYCDNKSDIFIDVENTHVYSHFDTYTQLHDSADMEAGRVCQQTDNKDFEMRLTHRRLYRQRCSGTCRATPGDQQSSSPSPDQMHVSNIDAVSNDEKWRCLQV